MLQAVGGRGRPPHPQSHNPPPTLCPAGLHRLPSTDTGDAFHICRRPMRIFLSPFAPEGPLVLSSAARDLVFEHCLREGGLRQLAGGESKAADEGARATPRIHLHAVVVIMPDHVHLLLSPLRDGAGWPFALVDILQCLKSATAHRINRVSPSLGASLGRGILRSRPAIGRKPAREVRIHPAESGESWVGSAAGGLSVVMAQSGI